MVLLTMTPTMVEALEQVQSLPKNKAAAAQALGGQITSIRSQADQNDSDEKDAKTTPSMKGNSNRGIGGEETVKNGREPVLSDPRVGNPISHGQVIDLWEELKTSELSPSLDSLLRGSRVYSPPPPSKPEPTSEYKALMARLRREEEARSYERMTNPPPPMETFAQRFPLSSAAHAFAAAQQPLKTVDEDEATYADVDRQIALIFNVLISILACAGAIWIAARWWSTPARLALSFSGSLLVGVAEVVVYSGYIRKVSDAKGKEKGIKEFKEVVNTWLVGGEADGKPAIAVDAPDPLDNAKARKRK